MRRLLVAAAAAAAASRPRGMRGEVEGAKLAGARLTLTSRRCGRRDRGWAWEVVGGASAVVLLAVGEAKRSEEAEAEKAATMPEAFHVNSIQRSSFRRTN